jgi:hypothetical protein
VRSCTACYLDLGDLLVPVAGHAADDAWLIHFLSDQQWVMHWLLYADHDSHEAVVATHVPLGFEGDEHALTDPDGSTRPLTAEESRYVAHSHR